MAYQPHFVISPRLLALVEEIAVLRAQIQSATVEVSWIPALQKDARSRNVHASTAIEGNPLTLEQVRAVEEGRSIVAADARSKREVVNYLAGLRFIEKRAQQENIGHAEIFALHQILADGVMEPGEAGRYRAIGVRVGAYLPPEPDQIAASMSDLLQWWNEDTRDLSPVLSSAILHYRFEAIHPFADGNGRAGRALAIWELYRRGFDSHHIFSIDEFYWENRPAYYAALDAVRHQNDDLSSWLEYSAGGIRQTLERVWLRVQVFAAKAPQKLILRPRQEQLLQLLRDHKSLAPAEIWALLDISKQGAMDLLRPLIKAKLVEKIGGRNGKYCLRKL